MGAVLFGNKKVLVCLTAARTLTKALIAACRSPVVGRTFSISLNAVLK